MSLQEKHHESVVPSKEKESHFFQYICTICVSFAVAGNGTFVVWTSAAFAYYQTDESEIHITKWQSSWIISIIYLGTILGCMVVPFLIDRLGRKKVFLIFSSFQIIGWLLIIFARDYITLCLARFCHGFAGSALFDFISVYIAEIADKKIRGKLGTMLKVSAYVGIFYIGLLGAFVSYQMLNILNLILPLIFICTFSFMPESPYFCLMNGRDEEAERILMKLRGVKKPESVKIYIESMKEAIEENKQMEKNAFLTLMSSEINRKCLLISFLTKGTKMLSGSGVMAGYTQSILVASGFEFQPKYSSAIIYGFWLISSMIAVGFIENVNRRSLFIVSGIVSSMALGFIGFYFFFQDYMHDNVSSISWVPMTSIILYFLFYCSGVGPVSYIIVGELFPVNVKGAAVNLGIIIENLCGFVLGLEYHNMNDAFGKYGTFWIFGLLCILGTITSYFFMPETRGKSLEEIQTELQFKKK